MTLLVLGLCEDRDTRTGRSGVEAGYSTLLRPPRIRPPPPPHQPNVFPSHLLVIYEEFTFCRMESATESTNHSYLYIATCFVLVAMVWGCTNPLLRRGSEVVDPGPASTGVMATLTQLVRTLANWRFTVPFVINQSGSLLYFWLLGSTEISMAVPIVNSLTFIFTALAARMMGEQQRLTPSVIVGTALIGIGVAVCVAEKL